LRICFVIPVKLVLDCHRGAGLLSDLCCLH
jgi:hypothetical protein